jgi:hypothetical protein
MALLREFARAFLEQGFSLAFSWLSGQSIKDTLCGSRIKFV